MQRIDWRAGVKALFKLWICAGIAGLLISVSPRWLLITSGWVILFFSTATVFLVVSEGPWDWRNGLKALRTLWAFVGVAGLFIWISPHWLVIAFGAMMFFYASVIVFTIESEALRVGGSNPHAKHLLNPHGHSISSSSV